MIPSVGHEGWKSWGLYGVGALTFVVWQKVLPKPMWLYVFGHELTHAITGLLSGAKIHSFRAHSHGGEVHLSKSNIFVALSPYIFPLYALLLIILYAVLKFFWSRLEITFAFQFLMGFLLAFHLLLTFSALHGRQSDLKFAGFFLSGVLITLGNTLILGLFCVGLFSKTPTFSQYTAAIIGETVNVWRIGTHFIRDVILRESAAADDRRIS